MSLELDFSRAQIISIIGTCGSGKSFLLRNLIYQFSKKDMFKFGIVFTGTSFNTDYQFMPDGAVHSDYSEAKLEKYISRLRSWLEVNQGQKLPPNFLILDDLLGRIKINSNIFNNLISTFRHFNMTIFITSQYFVKNISTLLRELTDVAFIFRTRFKNSKESLYNAYGQLLDSQDEFDEVLNEATKEKHSCLCYQARKEYKEESYCSFQAPPDDLNFKLKFIPVSF
jgi:ABC-type dipeptide/oligopeptide/nickel transport system ATPase component